MASSLDKPITLRPYFRLIWRRKGIVILASVSVFCASLVGLAFIPTEYESDATMVIVDRQRLVGEVERLMGGMGVTGRSRDVERMRLSELAGRVRSRPFLERVIRVLRMNDDPDVQAAAQAGRAQHPGVPLEELTTRILVSGIQSRIRVGSAGPGLYRIVVTDYSPENAQLLARWISELYVDYTSQVALEQMRIAREFGDEQLRRYEEELRRSEDQLERYKGSLIEQDLARSVVRSENLALAGILYRRVQDDAETARARVKPFLRAASQTGILVGVDVKELRNDSEVLALSQRLAGTLRNAINDQLAVAVSEQASWPPQGSYSVYRRELIQYLEQLVATSSPDAGEAETRAVVAYVFSQIDAETLADASRFLNQAIESYRRRAQSQPIDEMELARLETEVTKNRELLESFRSQTVASDLLQSLEATSLGPRVEILNPAELPLAPSRPNRIKTLLAALLIGPLLGAGVAFFAETTDSTLRSLEDFQNLVPEPVICTTPLLSKLRTRRRGIRRYWAPVALTSIVLLTAGFLVLWATVLQDVVAVGQPVQITSPEVIAP